MAISDQLAALDAAERRLQARSTELGKCESASSEGTGTPLPVTSVPDLVETVLAGLVNSAAQRLASLGFPAAQGPTEPPKVIDGGRIYPLVRDGVGDEP